MPISFTSRSRIFSSSGPSWLALVAVVWWAALLNPAQARSFSAGIFDGVRLPAAIVSTDRHFSLATSERHRADPPQGGSSPIALASVFTIALLVEPIQWLVAISSPPAARPVRSPAQPRAPPENT
jgi:hypothetical protein